MNSTLNTHNSQLVTKQSYHAIPFAQGLQWRGDGDYLYEEKKDGIRAARVLTATGELLPLLGERAGVRASVPTDSILVGEQMRSGEFFAFALPIHDGQDIRQHPARDRLARLDDLTKRFGLLRPARGMGGEFLEAIVQRGGEGVCATHLDGDWWQPIYKCKRAQVFHCIVLAKDQWKQSVELGEVRSEKLEVSIQADSISHLSAFSLGKMPLGYDRFHACRVGSILKVEAFGLTEKRQLREARPDKDTPTSWLIQY